MKSFRQDLINKLKNKKFKKLYDEEQQLLEISLKIHKVREKLGLSQKELACKATITQQQLSKIENGINCSIKTFLKVCNALNLQLNFKERMYAFPTKLV